MALAGVKHDAGKVLADLRDHLARHDKPLAFLFGAGTSCAVRVPTKSGGVTPLIPAVTQLTELAKQDVEALGTKFSKAWSAMETNCQNEGLSPNVENILSRLRMMLRAIGTTDSLVGLTRDQIAKVEEQVRSTVAKAVTPDLDYLSIDTPHRKFARWISRNSRKNPIEIFTVNYDVLLEHALEVERVPVFDGFVGSHQPFFHAETLRRPEAAPGTSWTRLWKMHGSVNWHRVTCAGGTQRVVRGQVSEDGEMIYPSFQKYDESRQQPYSAFAERLYRFLEQDDALLVVAGFSFGDEHINNLIFSAIENRPRTHVYSLQFEGVGASSDLATRAKSRPNMLVVCPREAIIGARRAEWDPREPGNSVSGAFEVSTDDQQNILGEMKIGDFSVLCEFLCAMTDR